MLFGVDWIDPLATGAIIVLFALVASGAAMLLATLVSNEHQLSAIGPALGMILALLGGAMVPIEVFPPIMQTLSHATPHAWAIEAFHELLLNGGGVADILPQLGRAAGLRGGAAGAGHVPLPSPGHRGRRLTAAPTRGRQPVRAAMNASTSAQAAALASANSAALRSKKLCGAPG